MLFGRMEVECWGDGEEDGRHARAGFGMIRWGGVEEREF